MVLFVDGQAAFRTLEVAGCLLVSVLVRCLGMLLLNFEELLDGAGTGEFAPNRFVWAEIRLWSFVGQ